MRNPPYYQLIPADARPGCNRYPKIEAQPEHNAKDLGIVLYCPAWCPDQKQ